MKIISKLAAFKFFAIAAAFAAALLPASGPASGSVQASPDPRTIVVTLLGGQQRSEQGELILSFDGANLVGLNFKTTDDRTNSLRRIGRDHPAEVKCVAKDSECGSLDLGGGTRIAACICKEMPRAGGAIPPFFKATLGGLNDKDKTCWDGQDNSLIVCAKIGSQPPPTTQTKEHILLARQVGVPSL